MIDRVILCVFRVSNHRVNPRSLVIRVLNSLWLPFSLVFWVINHRSLVISISFIIPVFWFFCFRIDNLGRDIIPSLRLLILGIIHHLLINPVFWLALLRILNLLRGEEVPVLSEASRCLFLAINLNNVCLIRLHNQGVYVCKLVVFTLDILLDEMLFTLVAENHVDLLGAVTADIRAKHNVILLFGFFIKLCSVETSREHLHVSTTAVDLLCMLDRKLNDQVLSLVIKNFIEICSESIEFSVLSSLQTLILVSISVPLP
mmetsp:Transcript_16088/g.22582  ORF Transcript_16088/g.22582 Transcript_16088/m.22582 type:complete len:259 (+) Transcript_16088:450-1226(+)